MEFGCDKVMLPILNYVPCTVSDPGVDFTFTHIISSGTFDLYLMRWTAENAFCHTSQSCIGTKNETKRAPVLYRHLMVEHKCPKMPCAVIWINILWRIYESDIILPLPWVAQSKTPSFSFVYCVYSLSWDHSACWSVFMFCWFLSTSFKDNMYSSCGGIVFGPVIISKMATVVHTQKTTIEIVVDIWEESSDNFSSVFVSPGLEPSNLLRK